MKVCAILPAKGNSERITSKNIKLLDGKPLFLHTLEKLCSCSFIDEVILDSDSDEILDYADYLPYKKHKRMPSLATNQVDGNTIFTLAAQQTDADILINIMCTFPFIKTETLKKGIDLLCENQSCDSVVAIKREKLYLWKNDAPAYNTQHIPNSKDLPDTISETMGLYFVRRKAALEFQSRIGKNPILLDIEPMESVDINYPEDFEMAETIAMGLRQRENSYFHAIAHFFNSSVFADILSEKHIHTTIPGLTLNLPHKKIFGRANTLKIRKLQKGEDYKGAYETYKTYRKIRPGEVMVIENELEDKAYFGEINAHLAVRAGAIGTIISSVTRDIQEVANLDYPVFSSGYCCADMRRLGTMDSQNKPVCIKGVSVKPGELIFADINGVVVIPREYETEVLKKAVADIEKEILIKGRILQGQEAYGIFEDLGDF